MIPRREWSERERVRDRKEPCLNIVGQRIGDQQRYKADDVREIFISKKRNMNRRRYGFVRFIGVDNVQ